jgi:hypothetical protein
MRWVDFRRRTLTTRAGEVRLVRGYWHCAACGTGCAPDDVVWDLPPGNASWGVRDGASLLGAVLPSFEKTAHLLEDLTLFQVSARSTESWTEDVGAAYAPPVPTPEAPAPAVDLVVIEADAGNTLWRTDNAWHEQKVYAAWGRRADHDQPIQYAVAQGPWAIHAPLVTNLAERVGVTTAREVLLLGDGAPALWRLLTGCYPEAFQLLDWYHLMEHLGAVAKLHPDGTPWLATQQEALRFRGPRETLLALKALHQRGDTAELRQSAGACLKYMWRHRQRLNYPEARRRGYPIGSGRIESAVKQVVQARAKQAGMRWNPVHLQQVLTARCAALNGDWACACAQTKAAVTRSASPPPLRLDPPQTARKSMPSRRPSASTREEPRSLSLKQMGQMVKQAFGF